MQRLNFDMKTVIFTSVLLFLCSVQVEFAAASTAPVLPDLPPKLPDPAVATPPLTTSQSAQLANLKELIGVFRTEVDWEHKDTTEGVLHWSVKDYSEALQAKAAKWRASKPACVEGTEAVRQDIVTRVGGFVKDCFALIYKRLEKALELANGAKAVKDVDCLVKALVDYHKYKNPNITLCTASASRYAHARYREENRTVNFCATGSYDG